MLHKQMDIVSYHQYINLRLHEPPCPADRSSTPRPPRQRRPPTADRERTSADRRASPRPPTPTMRTPPSRLLRPEAAATARHLQCSPQPTTPWTPPPPPALSPAPLRSGPTLPAPQLGDRRNAPTAPTANDHAHTDTHRPPDDQLKPAERAYTGTSQPPTPPSTNT